MDLAVAEKTSVVTEQSPVVTGQSPVVTGHSPVVAGQASSSEGDQGPSVGGQGDYQDTATLSAVAEDDIVTLNEPPSHIAVGRDPDKVEAGDLPYNGELRDIRLVFQEHDWKQKGSTLAAGNWKERRDWRDQVRKNTVFCSRKS